MGVHGWMGGGMNKQVEQVDGQMDGWVDRWVSGQMDGWIYVGQMGDG